MIHTILRACDTARSTAKRTILGSNPKSATTLALGVVAATVIGSAAHAAILSYDYSAQYTGSGIESSSHPSIIATFEDVSDGVKFTLTASGLPNNAYIDDVYFNLNPTLSPSALSFSDQTVSAGSFTTPTITTGVNDQTAPAAYGFDLKLDFANAKKDRFDLSDSYMVTIKSSETTLTAADFDFFASAPGNKTPLPTAMHVPGLGGGFGPNLTVPEPTTLVLTAMSGSLLLLRRRRSA